MPTRKLDKAEWRPFLDGISKLLEAKEVEIEVASLFPWRPGPSQMATFTRRYLQLEGRHGRGRARRVGSHDPASTRNLCAGGDRGLGQPGSVDSTGAKQIVKFRDQLLLASSR